MTWAVAAALGALVAASAVLVVFARFLVREQATWALAAAPVALTGLLADGSPTGSVVWDGVLKLAFVGLLTLGAGAAAPWWVGAAAVPVLVSCALADGAPQPAAMLAGGAVGLVLTQVLTRRRSPWLSAAAGALVAHAALGLAWPERVGGPSLVAAAAAAIVFAGARWTGGRRARVTARIVQWATLAAGIAVLAIGATSAAGLRDDVRSATSAVRAGLRASDDGDRVAALAAFDEAAGALDRTRDRLDRPLMRVLGAVPVLSQNLEAARDVVEVGEDLTAQGRSAVAAADPVLLRGPLGEVRLSAVEHVNAELAATDAAITEATARLDALDSPWLVSPLTDRVDELIARLADSQPKLARARDVTEILPGLLGADGDRRYFLAVLTPSELRGSIGIIGNYAELTAESGRLEIPVRGRDTDLNRGSDWRDRVLVAPPDYIARYERLSPTQFWQEVPSSPDFPTVAGVIAGLYPQSGGRPVDGVIGVDPVALAELLRLTGPVSVPGWDQPLNARNAERILLYEQYIRFDGDLGGRTDFLNAATEEIFTHLVRADLDPARLGEVVGRMVRERHVMFVSFDEPEAAVLSDLGGDGAFPSVSDGDVLGVVTHNRGGNKLDYFLQRSITHSVRLDDRGALSATVRVRLDNSAPATGLPAYVIGSASYAPEAYGTNQQFLSIYSPHRLVSATLDGQPVLVTSERELGMNVYTALVEVPPGGTATLTAELAGDVTAPYRLQVFRQTTVTPDRIRLELALPASWGAMTGAGTPTATTQDGIVAVDDEQRVAWEVSAGPAGTLGQAG